MVLGWGGWRNKAKQEIKCRLAVHAMKGIRRIMLLQ